jgi:hypothetical protein
LTSSELSQDLFASAISSLRSGTAPGHDMIRSELVKSAGSRFLSLLESFLGKCWSMRSLPASETLAKVVPIPKKNGGLTVTVDLCRPLSLMTSFYKVFANALRLLVQDKIWEFCGCSQAAYTRGRSVANNIFIVRQMAERLNEFGSGGYILFIDFKSAFDKLDRPALGLILRSFLDPVIVDRIELLFNTASAFVSIDGDASERYECCVGVRQGCPISPLLWNVAAAFIMREVRSRLALSGIKLLSSAVQHLEYADDCLQLHLTAETIEPSLREIVKVAASLGLSLSLSKCAIMRIGRPAPSPTVFCQGLQIPVVEQFSYLGTIVTSDNSCRQATCQRVAMADACARSFGNGILFYPWVNAATKGYIIRQVVFPTLLYACETATLSIRDEKLLDGYFLRLCKIILRLPPAQHFSYSDAKRLFGCSRPSVVARKLRLRWFGHVCRSLDSNVTEIMTFQPAAARPRGRPRRRWKDIVARDLVDTGVLEAPPRWTVGHIDEILAAAAAYAQDRSQWQKLIADDDDDE